MSARMSEPEGEGLEPEAGGDAKAPAPEPAEEPELALEREELSLPDGRRLLLYRRRG